MKKLAKKIFGGDKKYLEVRKKMEAAKKYSHLEVSILFYLEIILKKINL